jgi:nicotinate-nucleotide adenylyltransferase
MKILVFGGSFDPPHKGHAALLSAAARAVDPDTVLVVPAWRNPQKARNLAAAEDRLEMVKTGVLDALPGQWRRRAWIHTAEISSGRPVYTVDTLAQLSKDLPTAELHFAVGWDSAATIKTWRDPARLKQLAHWLTARRPGSDGEPPSFIKRLKAPMPAVSSSEIRARLLVGDDASDMLSPAVRAHIEARKLYGRHRLDQLEAMLTPQRYEHSRNVARLAGALARRWHVDEEQAMVAGLLHDCGRSVSVARMGAYARKRRLAVPHREKTARFQPVALHAHISEDLCRRRFGVKDEEVLSAVRKHTLGDPRMSPLDRVVYVADCCSEDREYPEAAPLRKLAFDDLDEAFKACVGNKLRWCMEGAGWIHPLTLSAWNSLFA